jgi:hypothetical protein
VDVAIQRIDPAATRVSGKVKDASASELFDKIARLADMSIVPAEQSLWDDPNLQGARFSADWDKESFWDAVREACEATGLRPAPTEPWQPHRSGAVRIQRGALREGATSVDGPVFIRVQRVTRAAGVTYFDGPRHGGDVVSLQLQVLPEPRVARAARLGYPTIDEASDEAGHALPATRPAIADTSSGPLNSARFPRLSPGQLVAALLTYPAGAGKKIAHVRGSVPLRLVTRMATVTFRDLPNGDGDLRASVGGSTLVLKRLTHPPGGMMQLRLELERGAKTDDDAWLAMAEPIGALNARIGLLAAQGEFPGTGGSATLGRTSASTDISFGRGEVAGEPTGVLVELPVEFTTVTAKFEFKDLPMP